MSADEIIIRHCRGMREMEKCVDLQRLVWGEKDLEIIPATCFVVAEHSGGQVLGAFHGPQMVGFTFATPAIRDGQVYLHSQMTGIIESFRNRNVGRRLKLFQREDALARGIPMIEWTFDPLETRNAHFNLDRLGATACQLVRNMYGITSSPLHRGLPTDRLVVKWYLKSPRVVGILSGCAPVISTTAKEILLSQDLVELTGSSREEAGRMQGRLSSEFEELFNKGYSATATARSPAGFKYLLEVLPSGSDR